MPNDQPSDTHPGSSATVGRLAPLSLRNLAAMLLLAVLWGLSIPVTKLGLQTTDPMTLTVLRFVVAVPLLFAPTAGTRPPPWRAVPRVAALGALGIGVGQAAQAYGVAGTSATAGTVVSATTPVLVVVFAALRLRQPASGRQGLGLLAAFAGVALVALGDGGGTADAPGSSALGVALMLVSAVAVAFYYVWSVELAEAHGTPALAAWSTLYGLLALLPAWAWEARRAPPSLALGSAAAALYLGVAVAVAGLYLWLHLLRAVPARAAASVQYLQPVVGVAAAAALFGDPLGAPFALGTLLVLGGMALTMAPARGAGR